MTIASEITRIRAAKAALMTAINSKGGTLTASQLLGDYAPAVDAIQTGGGETSFYQCASLDTAAGTWTGYKWEWDDTEGKYILSSSLTSDPLTIEGFKPIVGETYSGNTRESADMWEGSSLVFYAPLASASETAETGQTITEYNSPTFTNYDGKDCIYLNSSPYLLTTVDGTFDAQAPRTYSVEVYRGSEVHMKNLFSHGDENFCLRCYSYNNGFVLWLNGSEFQIDEQLPQAWTRLTIVNTGTQWNIYWGIELKKTGSLTATGTVSEEKLAIGAHFDGSSAFSGYMRNFAVFDKALSADEIAEIETEFPTA